MNEERVGRRDTLRKVTSNTVRTVGKALQLLFPGPF